eukprot:CAMPEP_0198308236 /NCGR_PEP_ID=MMETSP1450-20131203/950_1 /TAXON_ID=753684 ORGANISM="Madagascaria erythrocladiodes, Strain CCMP3234" /NCGR_SAMPLE_ID=MMETSP1450 /ASSEMBLY_ACC=CAM_ASM_001115 /LENGTH=351 /DNA_ID=CAMNT_0044010881 /DNA_START=106 /DNA_END=1161 /DNA_ORIENTATION=-
MVQLSENQTETGNQAAVGCSSAIDVLTAFEEACKLAESNINLSGVNVALICASVPYRDELESLGVTVPALLNKFLGLDEEKVTVFGTFTKSIGVVADDRVVCAQTSNPDLPQGQLLTLMLLSVDGISGGYFQLPRQNRHFRSSRRGSREKDEQVSAGLEITWLGARPKVDPDVVVVNYQSFALPLFLDSIPASVVFGGKLPNHDGVQSGTTLGSQFLPYSTPAGLALWLDKAKLQFDIIECKASSNENDQMDASFAEVREAYDAKAEARMKDTGMSTRPIFGFFVSCYCRYAGCQLAEFTMSGCDLQRLARYFPGVPTIGTFGYGEILPSEARFVYFCGTFCVISEIVKPL